MNFFAALERSVRLPSVATPSRAPSNPIIASSRTRTQVIAEEVGNEAIKIMQLRKAYDAPFHHEYTTKSDHTCRIDRRPDKTAAFDTIMKDGCEASDTITDVDPTTLDATSTVVVEFRWKGEHPLDLSFVKSVLSEIRRDSQAKRYTLQHYYFYFLARTIILITARKTAVCGATLKA